MNKLYFIPVLSIFLFSGCAVTADYSCGVPKSGVRCQSMDETSRQLHDGTLASLHTDPFPDNTDDDFGSAEYDDEYGLSATQQKDSSSSIPVALETPNIQTLQSKSAIYSAPKEMRIWFDRFTDPDGDLHDESFVFIRIDNGHWIINNKPVLY